MGEKTEIKQGFYTGERSLFFEKDLLIKDTVFCEGESPLKHSVNIELAGSTFEWKYPLWYSRDINVKDCTLKEMARAGIWYTNNAVIEDTLIEAPKTFRRCDGLVVKNVSMPNAQETLWNCKNVTLKNVVASGDYFGMNCENVSVDGLSLNGNYCFDSARNVEVKNAKLISKDSFWNCENITVSDSYISGEYLGWNSKNITLIRCTLESLQGMCFIDNLVMEDCKLINTTLAFEYSTVQATINGKVDSIKNPSGGSITADAIDELIMEPERVDVSKTLITIRDDQ